MTDELTILTTEYMTLQAARGACLQDMQGRTTFFLTVVSGALIALGFLGAASQFGRAFVVFAVTLLFLLWVLGLLTFLRIAQIGVEDTILAFGLSRIRHRYVELVPSVLGLFVRSVHDDLAGVRAQVGLGTEWWEAAMPTQSLVAFVISVVGGCEVAVVLSFIARMSLLGAVVSGIVACALNLGVLMLFSWKIWLWAEHQFPAKFPTGGT